LVPGLSIEESSGTWNYVYGTFSVATSGAYSFGVTASNGVDVLLILYDGAFDPTDPGLNGVAANDDTKGEPDVSINPAYTLDCNTEGEYYCPSLEEIELEAGNAYYMVISTYNAGDEVPLPITFYCIGAGVCSFADPSDPSDPPSDPPSSPPTISAFPIMQANQVRVRATMEYDCTSFGANGLCVSIGTRAAEIEAADNLLLATHAVLAYRVSDAFHLGGYVDVGTGGLPEGLEYVGPAPVMGAFIGFGSGLGWNGKATVALGLGEVVAVGADADTADTLSSIGIDGWAGYAFALDQNWIVMPVLGLRKTATSFNHGEQSLEETSANFTLRISGLVAERLRASFSLGADVTLKWEPEVEDHTTTSLFAAGELGWEMSKGLEMSVGGSARQLPAGGIGFATNASLTFAY